MESAPMFPETNDAAALAKEQKSFERKLWEKTRKLLNNEIVFFDNHTIVYKCLVDVVVYIIGSVYENEIMLTTTLAALIESINMVLIKYQPEKRTILENMDVIALTIDECIDEGIILEFDPGTIVSRVTKRSSDTVDLSLSDPQSLSDAFSKAKEQFFSGVLLK